MSTCGIYNSISVITWGWQFLTQSLNNFNIFKQFVDFYFSEYIEN